MAIKLKNTNINNAKIKSIKHETQYNNNVNKTMHTKNLVYFE